MISKYIKAGGIILLFLCWQIILLLLVMDILGISVLKSHLQAAAALFLLVLEKLMEGKTNHSFEAEGHFG